MVLPAHSGNQDGQTGGERSTERVLGLTCHNAHSGNQGGQTGGERASEKSRRCQETAQQNWRALSQLPDQHSRCKACSIFQLLYKNSLITY